MALLPTVVAQDELRSGSLQLYAEAPNIAEQFYCRHPAALTKRRLQTRNSPFGLAMECFRNDCYGPILAECDRHKAARCGHAPLRRPCLRLKGLYSGCKTIK